MPTYLVIAQADGAAPTFDHVQADSPQEAAVKVRDAYGGGLAVFDDGSRGKILVGLVEFDATGSITPHVDPAQVASTYNPKAKQPAIANLAAGANLATTVSKVNAILASMRAAGIIDQ